MVNQLFVIRFSMVLEKAFSSTQPSLMRAATFTTKLLSEAGFVVDFKDEEGDDQKETYKQATVREKLLLKGNQSALL